MHFYPIFASLLALWVTQGEVPHPDHGSLSEIHSDHRLRQTSPYCKDNPAKCPRYCREKQECGGKCEKLGMCTCEACPVPNANSDSDSDISFFTKPRILRQTSMYCKDSPAKCPRYCRENQKCGGKCNKLGMCTCDNCPPS